MSSSQSDSGSSASPSSGPPSRETVLALSQKFTQATHAEQQGDLRRAETLYRELLAQAPALIEPANNLAALLINQGRCGEGAAILEALLPRVGDRYEVHANLGLALQGTGRLAQAVDHLRRALDLSDPRKDPRSYFHSPGYLRSTARRLEHLASLNIPVFGKSVLEVGAGVGDLTTYYLDRGCRVLCTELRPENLKVLRQHLPQVELALLDMDDPHLEPPRTFNVVHCYGLLYHLRRPEQALDFLAGRCDEMLLLETCVSFGQQAQVNLTDEDAAHPTQAGSGMGCRPTRRWIFDTLGRLFPHVYVPRTQPNHAEFPLDWTDPSQHTSFLSRAVFVASRKPLHNDLLLPRLPDRQERHA